MALPSVTKPTSRSKSSRHCVSPVRFFWIYRPWRSVGRCKRACLRRSAVSSILIESLRDDLAALHAAGAIGKVTLRDYEALCPAPVRDFSAVEIRRLREALNVSQPVFALHLHTTASTIRKWEQGQTSPSGPALKLLNVIQNKGLSALL
ncbi:DNA-binding transcriptional regulator [Pseudomonas juntendi]|uniref:DNA-binding transcriptional regulator n=1 Tax=Pseudomonas juntendi TaxID=2666183 RepID=A0A7W2QAW7_9PSED|nr:DNA-binding transcriptional regulator [Pseudomonas juntendi]